MTQVTAEMLRRGRDLADMDAALRAERDGLIFMETSPRLPPITLYSMIDGEPIEMPPKVAELAIKKRFTDGRYMFTDNPAEAPPYSIGNVKCFLHPESPERALLDEIGMSSKVCHSEHLASPYAKRIHAQRRHRDEWAAFNDYRGEMQDREWKERQERQTEAMLAMAGKAAGVPAAEPSAPVADGRFDCPECGWVNEKNTEGGLRFHQSRWCKSKEQEDAGSPSLDEA